MDVNVNVTVELGAKTMSLINSITAPAPKAVEAPSKPAPKPAEAPAPPKPAPKPAEVPAPKPAPAPKVEAEAAEFGDLDADQQLEAIQALVTKHAKKGKASDIKFMLGQFDAPRASALEPANYEQFYNAIVRYGKGESAESIFPSDLD